MSYRESMEAAGAEVLAFEEFGSYQGDWWALVKYEGETGWVHGSYGSCSGCDSFKAEFDYSPDECDEHRYIYPKVKNCPECDAMTLDYEKRLAAFGKSYLVGGFMTQEEALKESLEWDYDSDDHVKSKEGEQTEFIKRF